MTADQRIAAHDDGFGLVEIVVSMLVLAILALAFLPVLITGIRQAAANATLATATQLVNEQIRIVQGAGTTCANVTALAGTQDLTDDYGVQIRAVTTVAPCPTGTGTVAVGVTATRLDTGAQIAEAATLVFVK